MSDINRVLVVVGYESSIIVVNEYGGRSKTPTNWAKCKKKKKEKESDIISNYKLCFINDRSHIIFEVILILNWPQLRNENDNVLTIIDANRLFK